jgi:DNA helicase-2/ATP-dependent DNA helicase PcrA
MRDKIEAIFAISESKKCKTSDQIIEVINSIFVETVDGIVLSTMHKSKGLEANNVFIIDRFRLPAPFAKQEWEREQEKNLDYVARTRAKNKLIYVSDWVSEVERMKDLTMSLMNIPK